MLATLRDGETTLANDYVSLCLGQRIALAVACTTIKKLSWNESPEVTWSSIRSEVYRGEPRFQVEHYVSFPEWENPRLVNQVKVVLYGGEASRWSQGELAARGWWQGKSESAYHQYFQVSWNDVGMPNVVFGTFVHQEEPKEHPFTEEQIQEIERNAYSEEGKDGFDSLTLHTYRCRQCAWTLERCHARSLKRA